MRKSKNGFDNMSTRGKILLLAIILCVFTIIVGVAGLIFINGVAGTYRGILSGLNERSKIALSAKSDQNVIVMKFYTMGAYALAYDDEEHLKSAYEDVGKEIDGAMENVNAYLDNLDADGTVSAENREILEGNVDKFTEVLEKFQDFREEGYDDCKKKNKKLIAEVLEQVEALDDEGDDALDALIKNSDERYKQQLEVVAAIEVEAMVGVAVCIIASLLLGLFLTMLISNSITRLIKKVSDASKKIAEGDFNVDVKTNLTNELGQLLHNFDAMVEAFVGISEDLSRAVLEMGEGDLDARIDESAYQGLYKDLALQLNSLFQSTKEDYEVIMQSVGEYSAGNFEYAVPRFPGKKAVLHESLDDMRYNLNNITSSVDDIIRNVSNGDFNIVINKEGFRGDWLRIVEHLQDVVATIAEPVIATKDALQNLANARFSVRLDETLYKGEFASMIRAVNTTASSISDYVTEISDVLNKMANQDLDVTIENEYIGDFERVKTSLELIIDTFNKLIDEIIRSSEQIMIGSNSIADSSNSLAQGASQQAAAVEELNVTIGSVATNANHNNDLVTESSRLSEAAKDSVDIVGKEMNEMYEAMKQINESSSNISAVLQAIDDIAFQTNILALNAAVEAARAGEHGKGFAIVADEVRNLASRSQTAVKDTATMIETAIAKAEQGSAIVDRTASTINNVIQQIEQLSKISDEVAVSSKQQNKSIGEINIGIQQISEVVSANTATSEESAAASQELASQADVFTKMVSKFKLRKRRIR